MNLFFRMLWVWWITRSRPRANPTGDVVLQFRVLPNDLDVFGHMNNARYLSIMDLGRLAVVIQTGIFPHLFRKKWVTLVAASRMRYRKPLNPFQRYSLHSRIVAWDDKWFYLEQRFVRGEREIAVGWIKGLLRGPAGNISTREVFETIGVREIDPPAIDGPLKQWIELEQRKSG